MRPLAARAAELDAADPLAGRRAGYVIADEELIYLDGNSLGRLAHVVRDAVRRAVEVEWGEGLVGSWERWLDTPAQAGDALGAAALGAAAGQVLVADSTTVNLFKLATAALRARPERPDVLTSAENFPTDRYVLDRVARDAGGVLRVVDGAEPAAVAAAFDRRVGLVSLSHVDYRTGALADLPGLSGLAREHGAWTLWDCSHSAGALPVGLDAAGVELAVGCTYKYLGAGPGAPAYLYVRAELAERLANPIPGWFGHAEQFAMPAAYAPAPGVARFAAGTPPVPGVAAVAAAAALLAEVGIEAVRAKSLALTGLLLDAADELLAPLGFRVDTPREPQLRGGHVALAHPQARRIAAALVRDARVVVDFRPPELIRLAPAPLSTRFGEVVAAVERIAALVAAGGHLGGAEPTGRVP